MSTTNSNNLETTITKKSLGKRFSLFLLKHIVTVLLLVLVFGVYVWGKIGIIKSEKQTIALTEMYESKIDSLAVSQMQLTAKTLSWAIRSEMQRENKEQVSEFFNEFVKQIQVSKLQYINADDNAILVSTNKKENGIILNSKLSNANKQQVEENEQVYTIATPVMGLNSKLGTLLIYGNK